MAIIKNDKYINLYVLEFMIIIVGFPLTEGLLQQALMIFLLISAIFQIVCCRSICIDNDCLVLALLLLVWTLFSEIYFGGNLNSLVQTTTYLSIVAVASQHKWDDKELYFGRNIFIVYIISWVASFSAHPQATGFQAYWSNSNALGMMALTAFVFVLMAPTKYRIVNIIFLMLSVFFVIVSSSRGALISLIVIILCYSIQRSISGKVKGKNKFLHVSFVASMVIAFVVSYIYPNLEDTALGSKLDTLLMHYTGKGLFTGRHYIWRSTLDEISKSPIIGLGAEYNIGTVIGDSRSVHNLYLQTILQTGWIGLVILCLFIFSLMRRVMKSKSRICIAISAMFIGVMIHEIFEVSLTQNNWPYGFIYWLVLGIGISKSRENDLEQLE